MTKLFALNPMVRRQTRSSRFSHYQHLGNCGDHCDMAGLTQFVDNFMGTNPAREVLRADGQIIKVSLPTELTAGFYSGVIALDENSEVQATFARRAGAVGGEAPCLQVSARGKKLPARHVDLIFYHADALTIKEKTAADGTVVDATWQLISINARATEEEEPATPMAMARNMAAGLGLNEGIGGTARTYSAEDFMRSILYWSNRAMAADQS
jgi:hypothetical protein